MIRTSGFTILEIIVSFSVIALISVMVLTASFQFNNQQALNGAEQEIISALDSARAKTLAAEGDSVHGVHFATTTGELVLFKGGSYNPSNPDNVAIKLNKRVLISEVSLEGDGEDVIFNRLTGYTTQKGTITVASISDPTVQRTISIEGTGLIGSFASSSTPLPPPPPQPQCNDGINNDPGEDALIDLDDPGCDDALDDDETDPPPIIFQLSVTANDSRYDLFVEATAAGWSAGEELEVTIEPGVVISSNNRNIPAFTTGGFASSETLTLINKGRIKGDDSFWFGGDALELTLDIALSNVDGEIWRGGGIFPGDAIVTNGNTITWSTGSPEGNIQGNIN